MTEGLKTDIIINRDALFALRELPDESVNCCVTSPPYYALRDYGLDAQIGREDTPEEYIERLVAVFHELKRVLRSDGTFWLNIADTYCGTGHKGYYADPKNPKGRNGQQTAKNARVPGCKQKDLIGIPWLLAFALRADGWYLRSDIIWQKENPMPESCKDRPSRCYEHIFCLRSQRNTFMTLPPLRSLSLPQQRRVTAPGGARDISTLMKYPDKGKYRVSTAQEAAATMTKPSYRP
jgi:DNA modification methylase